jgi:hypothetical protein
MSVLILSSERGKDCYVGFCTSELRVSSRQHDYCGMDYRNNISASGANTLGVLQGLVSTA